MLGNAAVLRTVDSECTHAPHDSYVLGYGISLSTCQWKLVLHHLGDEHIDMMKRGIASWRCGKGRIIHVDFGFGRITSDGIGHLLSLPHNTLSVLNELSLVHTELDSKSCEMLAHFLSSLSHLESLSLSGNQFGCDGVHLLSQFLHTNTTLKFLDVSTNNIGIRRGCS